MVTKLETSKNEKYHQFFSEYFDLVESGKVEACQEQFQLIKLIKGMLDSDDIYFDVQKAEASIYKPAPYFPFDLFPWQRFVNACVFGMRYVEDDRLVFNRILELVARGAGKTARAAWNAMFMTSGHHGVKNYDVDIVATSEDQAKKTFDDVYNAIDDPKFNEKLKKVYRYNRVIIEHRKTKSRIEYNTSNARTKDGKRTGAVTFDEAHEYEDYKNINVYTSGQGKVKDSRSFFTTTDGHVRGGVLDDLKEEARMVLNGEIKNSTLFPFICKLDDESEVDNPEMWDKANPSLPYLPELKRKMMDEYLSIQRNSSYRMEFMTKRMNLPQEDVRREVACYEDRLATNQELPDLTGESCIGGLDFSDTRDFTSVGLLFKQKGKRYWIHHTFIHEVALKTQNINMDIINLALEKGLCTIVTNEKSIGSERVVNWYVEMASKYNILRISMDTYRSSVLGPALKEAGFEIDIVRRGPATHAMLAPLVDDLFINHNLVFPDDPLMRWYVGNVYI
ncbi:MAG: terminase TerL endonuclease subunit, partial [Paenisporosarcina sp.]|nr:terminase TerL endonuclease subunit [Paenisporosarcina sp.]